MFKLKRHIIKIGILFMAITALLAGMAVPALATGPKAAAAVGLHTVEGKVNTLAASSFEVLNANRTSVIINVNQDTKFYQLPNGKAESLVNAVLKQDDKNSRKSDNGSSAKGNDMKNAHAPANWKDDLGWLNTVNSTAQFSDLQVNDRVVARISNDGKNMASQVIIIAAPAIQQVKGSISAVTANSLTVTPLTGTAVTVTLDAKTRVTLDGLLLVQNGQYAVVTYNRTTLVAQLINIKAAAPTADPVRTLSSIAVTPASAADLPVGSTRNFVATGTYSNGTTAHLTSGVVWASSNTAVATVSAAGLVSAAAVGSTQITASLSGITSPAVTQNVVTKTLTSINITPANSTVFTGAAVTFTATGTYSDGSTADVSDNATWTSSVPAVAANPAAGVTTALTAGSTVITAAVGTVSKTTNLTVIAATLTSIAVTPAAASIAVGGTQQYIATGTYSDGSTANLTAQVDWAATSGTGSATITTAGVATATSAGSVTITAARTGFTIPAVTLTVTAGV